MARTLIITNVDFSTNKLATVTLGDKPCTAITISAATASITQVGGTVTLTATVTPSDTTDAIVWGSSNTAVAEVAGGVVTATGCGTATITVSCGNFSATCAVTVTHTASLTFTIGKNLNRKSGVAICDYATVANRALGYSSTASLKIGNYLTDDNERYVIPIPNGATKVNITCTGLKVKGFWLSTTVAHESYPGVSLLYANSDSFEDFVATSRSVTIPDRTSSTYTGMNGIGLAFSIIDSSATLTQEMLNAVVVTFTA